MVKGNWEVSKQKASKCLVTGTRPNEVVGLKPHRYPEAGSWYQGYTTEKTLMCERAPLGGVRGLGWVGSWKGFVGEGSADA